MSIEPRPADAYESRFMRPNGALLHRERMVQQFHWIMLVQALVALAFSIGLLGGAVFGGVPAVAVVLSFLATAALALVWVLFSVLRVHVTTREVLIKLGPLGPRFAVEHITKCAVVPRPVGRYGGGKIRILPDGTREHSYMMATKPSELVSLEARDDRGKTHRVLLSSCEPAKLVEAIERARAQAGAQVGVGAPGVRVDGSAEVASAAGAGDEPEAARREAEPQPAPRATKS